MTSVLSSFSQSLHRCPSLHTLFIIERWVRRCVWLVADQTVARQLLHHQPAVSPSTGCTLCSAIGSDNNLMKEMLLVGYSHGHRPAVIKTECAQPQLITEMGLLLPCYRVYVCVWGGCFRTLWGQRCPEVLITEAKLVVMFTIRLEEIVLGIGRYCHCRIKSSYLHFSVFNRVISSKRLCVTASLSQARGVLCH